MSPQHNVLASLHIHGANHFSKRTRERIAEWLIKQAVFIYGTDRSEISSRFRARYMTMAKDAKAQKPKPKKKKVVNKKKAKLT